MKTPSRFALVLGVLAAACTAELVLADTKPADPVAAEKAAAKFRGTWAGTSICVGDHPGCNNESVVYRFVPFTAAPWQVRCLADKIVEGKRLPMGAIMLQYDDKSRGLRCEFTTPKTKVRVVWSFVMEGDSLRGDLTHLPDGDKVRDVRAARVVDESKLPAAPLLKEYDE